MTESVFCQTFCCWSTETVWGTGILKSPKTGFTSHAAVCSVSLTRLSWSQPGGSVRPFLQVSSGSDQLCLVASWRNCRPPQSCSSIRPSDSPSTELSQLEFGDSSPCSPSSCSRLPARPLGAPLRSWSVKSWSRKLMYLSARRRISFLLSFLSGGCVGMSRRSSAKAPLTFCCRQRSRLLVKNRRTTRGPEPEERREGSAGGKKRIWGRLLWYRKTRRTSGSVAKRVLAFFAFFYETDSVSASHMWRFSYMTLNWLSVNFTCWSDTVTPGDVTVVCGKW